MRAINLWINTYTKDLISRTVIRYWIFIVNFSECFLYNYIHNTVVVMWNMISMIRLENKADCNSLMLKTSIMIIAAVSNEQFYIVHFIFSDTFGKLRSINVTSAWKYWILETFLRNWRFTYVSNLRHNVLVVLESTNKTSNLRYIKWKNLTDKTGKFGWKLPSTKNMKQ